MVRLSVNVNKVATLRNARGGVLPSVCQAVRVCLEAGVRGITVHPRADERHITGRDVREVAELLSAEATSDVEYNIEGDPRPDWLALVEELRPTQATVVPVRPGEVTSEAGWDRGVDLRPQVARLQAAGARVSLFVAPQADAVRWAADMGADRVELYTGPFGQAWLQDPVQAQAIFREHVQAAETAAQLGLEVNAGHDLDLDNLSLYRRLPHLAEVSIGHALMARALFVGLERVVGEYLALLSADAG